MSVVQGSLDANEQAIVDRYNNARTTVQAFIDLQTERPVSEQILRANFERELFVMAGAVNQLIDLAIIQGAPLQLTVPAATVSPRREPGRTYNNPARTTVKAAGMTLYWNVNSALRASRTTFKISQTLELTQLQR